MALAKKPGGTEGDIKRRDQPRRTGAPHASRFAEITEEIIKKLEEQAPVTAIIEAMKDRARKRAAVDNPKVDDPYGEQELAREIIRIIEKNNI